MKDNMVNRIEMVQIEGKIYNTEGMTSETMSEFVMDVNSNQDTDAVCRKYGAAEVS